MANGVLDCFPTDDVLDSIPEEGEEEVLNWFEREIRRHAGGLDRATVTLEGLLSLHRETLDS